MLRCVVRYLAGSWQPLARGSRHTALDSKKVSSPRLGVWFNDKALGTLATRALVLLGFTTPRGRPSRTSVHPGKANNRRPCTPVSDFLITFIDSWKFTWHAARPHGRHVAWTWTNKWSNKTIHHGDHWSITSTHANFFFLHFSLPLLIAKKFVSLLARRVVVS